MEIDRTLTSRQINMFVQRITERHAEERKAKEKGKSTKGQPQGTPLGLRSLMAKPQ